MFLQRRKKKILTAHYTQSDSYTAVNALQIGQKLQRAQQSFSQGEDKSQNIAQCLFSGKLDPLPPSASDAGPDCGGTEVGCTFTAPGSGS